MDRHVVSIETPRDDVREALTKTGHTESLNTVEVNIWDSFCVSSSQYLRHNFVFCHMKVIIDNFY